MPVTGLPGGHGIGDFKAWMEQIDDCVMLGIGAWQILPLGETGGDNSPYNALSANAIERALIHLSPGWFQAWSSNI